RPLLASSDLIRSAWAVAVGPWPQPHNPTRDTNRTAAARVARFMASRTPRSGAAHRPAPGRFGDQPERPPAQTRRLTQVPLAVVFLSAAASTRLYAFSPVGPPAAE